MQISNIGERHAINQYEKGNAFIYTVTRKTKYTGLPCMEITRFKLMHIQVHITLSNKSKYAVQNSLRKFQCLRKHFILKVYTYLNV